MLLLQALSVKKWLLLPFYVLAVFTWSKSFRSNPIIGSYVLNRLGLHVFRVVLAQWLFNFRLLWLSPLATAEDRNRFREQGFIVKDHFLPDAQFQALKAELLAYQGPMRELKEGDTLTQRVFLTRAATVQLPQCLGFIKNPQLSRLIRYASSKNRIPFFYAENLKHGIIDDNSEDPQKHLHADAFYPCVKAWLFMDDVTLENGPFTYVPGSHRLTWGRLRWEYAESLKSSQSNQFPDTQRYWDGSFRATDGELQAMGYPKPKALTVAANTLVIANVYGFHKRGRAQMGTSRMSIWMQARDNPFNPLVIICPQLTARAFEWAWSWYLRKRDAKMLREGKQTNVDSRFQVAARD